MAVRQFISNEQTLTPVVTIKADDKKVARATKQMLKDHAHMLEKLK